MNEPFLLFSGAWGLVEKADMLPNNRNIER